MVVEAVGRWWRRRWVGGGEGRQYGCPWRAAPSQSDWIHRRPSASRHTCGHTPHLQEASLDEFFAEVARKGQPERQSKRERSAPTIYGDSDDEEPKHKGRKDDAKVKKEVKVGVVGFAPAPHQRTPHGRTPDDRTPQGARRIGKYSPGLHKSDAHLDEPDGGGRR